MNQLFFNPDHITVAPDTEFSVDVMLDTGAEEIDGADIILPLNGLTLVSLVDHHLMPFTAFNAVESGILKFSQITSGGQHYTGSGALLTLTLKTTQATTMRFSWTAGSTNLSTVAAHGTNIITSVGNLIINLEGATMSPELQQALHDALAAHGGGKLVGTFTPPPTPPASVPFDIEA